MARPLLSSGCSSASALSAGTDDMTPIGLLISKPLPAEHNAANVAGSKEFPEGQSRWQDAVYSMTSVNGAGRHVLQGGSEEPKNHCLVEVPTSDLS